MLLKKISTVALVALAACWLPAHAQLKIGVVTSSTGPTALVGIPQKNYGAAVAEENRRSERRLYFAG